jgi:hypothetical protein
MAPRVIKLREQGKSALATEQQGIDQPEQVIEQKVVSQKKRPEIGRFWLQVDRQTKGSYATIEAAKTAGMVVKKSHPILQVAVYDSVDSVNTLLELP